MKKHILCKRILLLVVGSVLVAGLPGFAMVSPEEAGSALARMEYLRSSTPTKTPEQVQGEYEQAQAEKNQRVFEEMKKPPVGFAPYENAGLASAGSKNVGAAGKAASSEMSSMQKNLLGLLFLGLVFFVAGLVLRKKQPPPDEPDKSFPRKFSA